LATVVREGVEAIAKAYRFDAVTRTSGGP